MKLLQRLDHLESRNPTKEKELDTRMSMSFLNKVKQLEALDHNEKLSATKARNQEEEIGAKAICKTCKQSSSCSF